MTDGPLVCQVERIVFASPDSSYTVARLRVDEIDSQTTYDNLLTIVGDLRSISEGEVLRVGGEFQNHPRHGRHFRVNWFERRLPSTTEGIKKFLGSGVIKGIGAGTAEQVVGWFGEQTIHVIEHQPDRLREVPKLSKKRAELIIRGWQEQSQARELMLFLQSHGLPAYIAKRLREQYGDECVAVLQRDPYQLVQDVFGIGFKTSDAIAVKLGLSPHSLSRFMAGLRHVLDEATREGNVYLPRNELLKQATQLLAVSVEHLEPALLEAQRENLVVCDEDRIYAPPYFYAEKSVANRLQHIELADSFLTREFKLDPAAATKATTSALGVALADKQLEAITTALRDKVSIITGGPGTGKTMCLHAVISALDAAGAPYSLCAPTGRAAKRMAAATGRQASTIHRLLGYQPSDNSFTHNRDHPLEPRVVVVDEVSMVDILLFNHLLTAISDESHLVLVGDSDQLPAVGAGNVLSDLMESGTVSSVELDQLFRQSEGSQITAAAHDIRRGRVPTATANGDLYLVPVSDPQRAQEVIEEMVSNRIPDRFKFDPKLDIQVMSPIHRGAAGVSALNNALQARLNPDSGGRSVTTSKYRLRVGDKVMQIKNNYDKEVSNGDVGLVSGIDAETGVLTVRFGEQSEILDVDYEFTDLNELVLAYAVSIHKAQGSEFPCAVFPILTTQYALLQRNLIYTALTRAKQLCVIVYQTKALELAIRSNRKANRFSYLAERLKTVQFEPALEFSIEPF